MSINNKIVILHVFDDEKFFDFTARFFDALENVLNKYCFYTPQKEFKFKKIKSTDKIEVFNDYKKYCRLFSSNEIDIIYFHSLFYNKYKLFNYISNEKIVIWWSFGADIYHAAKGMKPLVQLDLYKPLTKKYIVQNTSINVKIKSIVKTIFSFYYERIRNKVINRIDYFSPVLPLEYHLMKKNPQFRAKPFMINSGPGIYHPKPLPKIKEPQNILIGNSLTYSNNHLDIFKKLNDISIAPKRKYVVPISYGDDFPNAKQYFKQCLKAKHIIWLEKFIPLNEYTAYLDSITHAIFGFIRQQAIGNINFCLERGVKIFLYSDSLIYKQLKSLGFKIYTIDQDLTLQSLNEPLDTESAKINYDIFCETIKDRISKAKEELTGILTQ